MHDDITNVASATAFTVVLAIAMNLQANIPVQTMHHLNQSTKAAHAKPFDRNWDKREEFITSYEPFRSHLMMQADRYLHR